MIKPTLLLVAVSLGLSAGVAHASARDAGFSKAMAIYGERAEVTKHVEAVSAFSELAKALQIPLEPAKAS